MVKWEVAVRRFYIELKGKKTKNGKPLMVPITHRRLYFKAPSICDSGDYRVVAKKGKFTISVIPRIPQSHWTNPSGRPEVWYTYPPDEKFVNEDGSITVERPYKRTDDKPKNEAEILRWLTSKMGEVQARVALITLLTAEPESSSKMAA